MSKLNPHLSGFPGTARGKCGFTLTELMVAVALSGLFVTSAMQTFILQRRALNTNQVVSEMRQDVRTAMDMLSRDLRMAGYGLDMEDADLSSWLDWAVDLDGNSVTMSSNPLIVDGGTGADSVWIASAFDNPQATLLSAASAGATTLTLASGEGSQFNNSQKKVLFLGRTETIRILSVSGDTLTISTDPTQSVGLANDYPAGSQVELVTIRSYEWNAATTSSYPYKDFLTRDESISSQYTYYWQRMVATGIEDFQVSQNGNRTTVSITGKATADDNWSTETDKRRRMTLSADVFMRNLVE